MALLTSCRDTWTEWSFAEEYLDEKKESSLFHFHLRVQDKDFYIKRKTPFSAYEIMEDVKNSPTSNDSFDLSKISFEFGKNIYFKNSRGEFKEL